MKDFVQAIAATTKTVSFTAPFPPAHASLSSPCRRFVRRQAFYACALNFAHVINITSRKTTMPHRSSAACERHFR